MFFFLGKPGSRYCCLASGIQHTTGQFTPRIVAPTYTAYMNLHVYVSGLC